MDEIEEGTFATKGTELRDRLSNLNLQIDACDRGRAENAEIAVKAFVLSQTLKDKWLNADYRAKHQMLVNICLNFSLDGVLAKGHIFENSRGNWTPIELFSSEVGTWPADLIQLLVAV